MTESRPELIDIGANLTHDSFDTDREAVLSRAREAGVYRVIVTGADLEHSHAARKLANEYPGKLFATAGIHPHQARTCSTEAVASLRALLTLPEVVAVGECGLDYFRNFSPRSSQQLAFQHQLQLACEIKKPLFLHQRDAHADFLAILDEMSGNLPAIVVHCFTGTRKELEAYLERGFYIGITGWICDERRGHHLRELVPMVPGDRLMLETDAPYLLPRDLSPKPRSRRNEPRYLAHIATVVAKHRRQTLSELARETVSTTEQFFGLASISA